MYSRKCEQANRKKKKSFVNVPSSHSLFRLHDFVLSKVVEGVAPRDGSLKDYLWAFLDEREEDDLATKVAENFPKELINAQAATLFVAVTKFKY